MQIFFARIPVAGLSSFILNSSNAGTATRQCLSNKNKPVWAQPDLSRCVSPEFDRILTDVDTLMEAESVTLDALTNITNGVQEIIRQKTGKRMYAGDLTVATDTVEKVTRLVKRVNGERDVLENIAKVSFTPKHINSVALFTYFIRLRVCL